jgi:hypothetical protein
VSWPPFVLETFKGERSGALAGTCFVQVFFQVPDTRIAMHVSVVANLVGRCCGVLLARMLGCVQPAAIDGVFSG